MYKEKENEILYSYKIIPNISLIYALTDSRDYYVGEIRGFVKFLKEEDQPKGARQYYILKPMNDFYSKTNQFSAETILSLSSLSPQSVGLDIFNVIESNEDMLTISNSSGIKFLINKKNKQVKMIDSDGDTVELITSDIEYKKFVLDDYRNK